MKLHPLLLGLALLASLSTAACSRHSVKGSAALQRAYGNISTSVARHVERTTRKVETLRLVKWGALRVPVHVRVHEDEPVYEYVLLLDGSCSYFVFVHEHVHGA